MNGTACRRWSRATPPATVAAMGRSLASLRGASRPFSAPLSRAAATGCPFSRRQRSQVAPSAALTDEAFTNAKPYSEVPGPKPIPILGNTWRMVPVIGQFDISEFAKVTRTFLERYGKITRLGGLIGRPDLLFVYDADEIERMYRREGPTPFRPAMPCLVKYKSEVRKDFFGELPGVVGV
ncbi:unnamed protein product [Leptidea sinapis]|uniref:Cytochrome P450 n=1 Tax=Leptidea sinapis TaxID=189913 RepID=A0A5E4QYK7_9NEOP|nr:unnamed protein product [Leptidea sinapis]